MAAAEVLRKSTKHIVNIFEDVHRFSAVALFDSTPPPPIQVRYMYSVQLSYLSPSLSSLCVKDRACPCKLVGGGSNWCTSVRFFYKIIFNVAKDGSSRITNGLSRYLNRI
jgi:hypothetical protein